MGGSQDRGVLSHETKWSKEERGLDLERVLLIYCWVAKWVNILQSYILGLELKYNALIFQPGLNAVKYLQSNSVNYSKFCYARN